MTAFHSSTLSGVGAPETPAGGSVWSRLKSRIKRRLLGVDIVDLGCRESGEDEGGGRRSLDFGDFEIFLQPSFRSTNLLKIPRINRLW